jgi:DivIVA domain-containing protein
MMNHSETIGRGGVHGVGARLARLFSPVRTGDEGLQETVEFAPDGAEAAPAEAWAPRFATVWRGYDPEAVDSYVGALEDELAAVRAEHVPQHAVQAEIERISNDTAEIIRVAHEKAEAIASRARAQADLMLAEAQAQAEATTRDAEVRRRTLDADTDLIWHERTRLLEDTRKLADCMLSVADDAVERFPPETAEPPAPETAEPPPAAAVEPAALAQPAAPEEPAPTAEPTPEDPAQGRD